MSTGCFLGIKSSYVEAHKEEGEIYISCINEELSKSGFDLYHEPETIPDIYDGNMFGCSALDHHSSACLVELGELGIMYGIDEHLKLLALNPYRLAFVPILLENSMSTNYKTKVWDQIVVINFGSSFGLKEELSVLARFLDIDIKDGNLVQTQVDKINEMEPFEVGEDGNLIELRSAWLLMFEGARLSIEHNVALSLAG